LLSERLVALGGAFVELALSSEMVRRKSARDALPSTAICAPPRHRFSIHTRNQKCPIGEGQWVGGGRHAPQPLDYFDWMEMAPWERDKRSHPSPFLQVGRGGSLVAILTNMCYMVPISMPSAPSAGIGGDMPIYFTTNSAKLGYGGHGVPKFRDACTGPVPQPSRESA
jgi:hypothetical protein